MRSIRRLAAFLGCLAALSAMLPGVVLAWTKSADLASTSAAVSQPCPNCRDCDPCHASDTACAQVCVSPLPSLIGMGPVLPDMERSDTIQQARLAVLHGLSPPPDPFPPRA